MNTRLHRFRCLGTTLVSLLATLLATPLLAGPLAPPSGAVAPSGKTLTDLEPRIALSATNTPGDNDATPSIFKINQSGSYYLTGNVTLSGGRNGIEVTVSGVTIDLNGFSIAGLGGPAGIIATNSAIERITIRNGTMFGATTAVSFSGIRGVSVEDLKLEACINGGIVIGDAGAVRRCTVINCGSGVVAGIGAEITSVTVTDSDTGISCGTGSRITNCTVSTCGTSTQSRAFSLSVSCVVVDSTATANTGTGFYAAPGCTLSNCAAFNNGGDGFVAVDPAPGTAGCVFTACAATFNDAAGFNCDGSTLTGCSAYSNTSHGFTLNWCKLADSVAIYNNGSGIVAQTNCVITSCLSNNSAAAGILITGSRNVVDGNNCTSGSTGVACTATGNFIVRNVCSNNTTEWNIVAGNQCLVVLGFDAPAILGDSGGASPGSTNPNANYTY